MSWKSTKKTFERLPQNLGVKTGLRTATKDIQFNELLSRFNDLHTRIEKIHKDSRKFRDSFSNMLNYQANISDIMVELYKPIVGKNAAESTVRRVMTPVKSMNAIEEFQNTMTELRDILLPELNLVDDIVVKPLKDFEDTFKMIKKTITKRDHKKLDFDRYTASVNKLQGKKDKSINDEKSLVKAEENLTKATEEYEYYNELFKDEIPKFIGYGVQLVEIIITNFYHLQLKIYEILYEKMDPLISNIGHFEVQSDIIERYDERKAEINKKMENQLTLLKGKKGPKKESISNNKNGPNTKSTSDDDDYEEEEAPPAYTSSVKMQSGSRSLANPKLYPVQKKVPPPLPPHGSKPKLIQYVRALYDYDAQESGDLSFKKGDKIEVIERTGNVDDWWKGKLNGITGVFPGNYVEDW